MLHVRELAWLNSVPENAVRTRARMLRDKNGEEYIHDMPDILGCEYLMDLLLEAGTVRYEGAVCHTLTWQELEAWLNCTQLSLNVWEITTLRALSQAYALETNLSRDEYRPSPTEPPKTEEKIKKSMEALKAGLRSFMNIKK